MRVIVTGAASFIGGAVVRELLDEGHTVLAVVRPASESTERFKRMLLCDYPQAYPGSDPYAAGSRDASLSRIQVLKLDLKDIDKLPCILRPDRDEHSGTAISERPSDDGWDVFLHAGWEGAGSENRAREDVQSSNITLTLTALRAAAALGCGRFIFTGSQAEYGNHRGITSEQTPCSPVSPYGKAKVAVGEAAFSLSKELGIDYIHARLYSVYGPGDHPWSLVSSCLDAWRQKKPIELGPCTQLWNFLHVDDAASALVTLMGEGHTGFYNIAGEDTRPLSYYIEEMAHICRAEGLYTFGDREPNVEGPADLNPDISKIKKDTLWRPKISFYDGISQMWRMETENETYMP